MDVHPSGFAWIRFYYGDNDYDEFRHHGNGSRRFWLKNKGEWSPWLGMGDASAYLPQMGINRDYYFRGIRNTGTSTWEFVNREPGLTKIVFEDNAGWGGMRGIYILNYENLVEPPGGGGGGNGPPILENPYYLNEYVYRQSTLGLNGGRVDQANKIPEWSNHVHNTKTIVRNTANSFDHSDHFTYFYDGYISFPVNTRKYFGLASDDDSFMWIVEGDRLWSTVGHYHLYPAFSLADLIEQTGDNNVVFFIDDRNNHGFPGSFQGYRTGHFDFEANKLYTILMKITEHAGGAGLFWAISDNSLQNVGRRNDNFPQYFGTGYTRITINNPPIKNPPTLAFSFYDNGAPFDFDFSSRFTDPDGDNLTYSIEYTSNLFTASIQDPHIAKIRIIPNNLQLMETVYSETIAVTATDTFGNVSEQDIITITVRAFNDPPIYTGADILYYREDSEDLYLDLNTIFIDPEVNPSYPLSFQVAPHDVGIINTELNNDTLKLNFLENKNGDTQLSITATDVGNKSTTANIILRVNPVNDKPYAIPSQYPFDRHVLTIGQEVKIDINEPEDFRREYLINLEAFINDEEDARLDYSLTQSTNPQLFIGEIFEDNNTKWLRLQFLENASGTGRLIVTATDRDTSNPKILKVVWNVNINPVNDAPVATYTAPRSVNEDSIITGQLTGNDVDGDAITYSLVSPIPGLTLNPNGSFSFDATHSDYQSLGEGAGQNIRVNYKVTDIQGAEGTNSFTITVIGTNDIPVATYTAPGSVNEDSIISGQLSGTDIDNGDTLTYSLVSSISGLTLNADGSFTFDASDQVYQSLEKNEILSIIVNYKVTDSQGVESETNSFTINVTGSNDTPVATYTTNRDVDEDATISGNLTAITYSLEKAVLGLTLYTDGRFTFNAGHEHYQSLEKDEILNIIVNYKATDSQEAFDTKSFTITVIGTNDTPVATYIILLTL
jgi:VCBS repeat-containing protein